jgi:hypothetical protein
LLYIHLSLFTDTTVIAISYPHTLSDQFGISNIMRAWFGLIRGETPPAMVGYDNDVLAGEKSYDDYVKDDRARTGKIRVRWPLEYVTVALGLIPELIWHPKEDSHILFFPHAHVQALRQRFSAELKERNSDEPGLSTGDVLSGVLAKVR